MNSDAPNPARSSGELLAGQTVGGGRYVLKQILGQGGMGLVWLAHDQRLREAVALKFLPAQITGDTTALEDLRRETLRSRKLSHPNVVRIYDLNEGPNELTFISMEYIDGPDLHWLRSRRPAKVLSWKFLAPLARQLCAALDYAHGEGIVHRDIKPANLMLASNARLKLADFGLACVIHDSMTRLSGNPSLAVGTLQYMSPQQADGKKPAATDDIYALGATLYELLTSRPPFYTGDIGYQVRHTRPQPMAERLLDLELANLIPSEVSALVMACLAKEPQQRPPGAKSILEWLEAVENKPDKIAVPAAEPAKPPPVEKAPAVPQPLPPTPPAASLPPPPPPAAPKTPPPPPSMPVASEAPRPTPTPLPPVSEPEPVAMEGDTTGPQTISSTSKYSKRYLLIAAGFTVIVALGLLGWYWAGHQGKGEETFADVTDSDSAPPVTNSPGTISIFNPLDFSAWEGDPRVWSVKDGMLAGHANKEIIGREDSTHLFWKTNLDDFELNLSLKVERGNSGILYRSRQLTNWDAGGYQFELWKGSTGGLIDNGQDRTRRDLVRVPRNRSRFFKAAGWNHLTIIAQGGRLIHKINGHTICDFIDKDENRRLHSGLLALECQADSDTSILVKWIHLKRLGAASNAVGRQPETATLPKTPDAQEWITLFDGLSLGAWEGQGQADISGFWKVEDGALKIIRNRRHVNLVTKENFENFELELEWAVSPIANSGIFIRVPDLAGEVSKFCPEMQLVDDDTKDGQTPSTSAGSLYGIVAPTNKILRPVGQFNQTRIVAQGGRVEYWLNGSRIVAYDLSDPEFMAMARRQKSFSRTEWGWAKTGRIALQHLQGEVSFRNIRVHRLP